MINEEDKTDDLVAEGKKFIAAYANLPRQENIGEMYDSVDPKAYDMYTELIKFGTEQTEVTN